MVSGCVAVELELHSRAHREDHHPKSTHAICELEAETGPCRALFLRWHFDMATKKCMEFVYGGCQGNENNFLSEEECYKACSPRALPVSLIESKYARKHDKIRNL